MREPLFSQTRLVEGRVAGRTGGVWCGELRVVLSGEAGPEDIL
jgi:hypothetical protein